MKISRYKQSIGIRLTEADRQLIERAAEKIRVSMSDLGRHGTIAMAKYVLTEISSERTPKRNSNS
jgi:hypothetical protein